MNIMVTGVSGGYGAYALDFLIKNSPADVKLFALVRDESKATVVHAGYVKHRMGLLENGVKLYELKPESTVKSRKIKSIYDGSGASLHAKTFTVDGRYLYVGSFNFDPRSADLNTEMGVIIGHAELAGKLRTLLEADQLRHIYAVSLNEHGKAVWQTRGNDGQLHSSDKEPEASLFRRMQVWVASRLPIDWLL